MGWDSAAPTSEELGSANWAATPPTEDELNSTSEKSLSGFGKNLVSDVAGTAKSLFGPGGMGQNLMEHPINTVVNTVKNLPGAAINEGKRIGAGELLTGHPINAIEKFGQAAYDKPLTTAMDVLPLAGGAAKALGFGADAAKGAELASTAEKAAPVAEAAAAEEPGVIPIERVTGNAMPAPAEAAARPEKFSPTILPNEPALPPQPGPVAGAIDEIKNYIGPKIQSAKGAVEGQYAKQAGRPGWATNVADYLQEKSQMMANQDLGATPLQARQVGHEGMRAIGQYAMDNDIVSPTSGLRGMRARNAELLNKAGQTLSNLRKEADALRDPVTNPIDVLQQVKARLDPKYATALNADEAPEYMKALKAIEESEPTHQGFAETATDLNAKANKAARLQQPHGPFTDVANAMSDINNERIKQLLGPEKASQYEQALRDYGVNKKIESFLARKAGGEVKRIGPGSFTSNMIQKGMDELGYKVGARALNKTSTAVLKNPSVAKTLPSLFKQFIHDVELPEPNPGQGMAHGGVAGMDDLNDFLSSKYGKKEN